LDRIDGSQGHPCLLPALLKKIVLEFDFDRVVPSLFQKKHVPSKACGWDCGNIRSNHGHGCVFAPAALRQFSTVKSRQAVVTPPPLSHQSPKLQHGPNGRQPWFPGTVSWVVPTAFAVLALNQLPCSCGGLEQVPFRVERGVEMLLDRVCPGGGWNAGNGVVYGVPVAPHPDDTGIALLALREHRLDHLVQSSVQYLERIAPSLTSPWSLAWVILALAAHRRPIDSIYNSLASSPNLTLALACLALDQQRALSALGVTS
jgi:hypothetical protein